MGKPSIYRLSSNSSYSYHSLISLDSPCGSILVMFYEGVYYTFSDSFLSNIAGKRINIKINMQTNSPILS